MCILYLGKYKKRFCKINELIKPDTNSVVELCFGDICIAEHCQKIGINWKGYDINPLFVKNAINAGHNAIVKDIETFDNFDTCDTCVMMGSLYHFKDKSADIVNRMIAVSKQVIISEPIKNLSLAKGVIGYIARKSASVGKGSEEFRFNETTFLAMLDSLNVNYKIISIDKDILIEITND